MKQNNDLTFKDTIQQIKESRGEGEWITVYLQEKDDSECFIYCALISNTLVQKSLKNPSWDLFVGNGFPGFVFNFENGIEVSSYYRFSSDGVEPLVFYRSFHGVKNEYWEISEEFRHYFNLYEDKKKQ